MANRRRFIIIRDGADGPGMDDIWDDPDEVHDEVRRCKKNWPDETYRAYELVPLAGEDDDTAP